MAVVVGEWVHLWVGHHFHTSELEPDFDTAEPDTQRSAAAAAVQH